MLCFGRSALWLKRGTACSLSVILPCGVGGIDQLESFGFWRRKFCIKNAEILSVGKIAEFAKFAGEKDESLQTAVCLIERSELWMVAFCGFRRKT